MNAPRVYYNLRDGERLCVNCQHFIQHYTNSPYTKQGWTAINAGHCTTPRLKDRKPLCAACIHWETI